MLSKYALSIVALLTFASSAFAIQFIDGEYYWNPVVGTQFTVDLNTLVTDVDRTQPITWSSDHLPDWATIDQATGILSGTPTDKSMTSDIFSILAVQNGAGAAAKVYMQVMTANDLIPWRPVWFPTKILMEGCVGHAVASDDLGMKVELTNPGTQLPIPEIVINSINKPAWLTEVRQEQSYYLTGTPTAVQDTFFTARACARTTCSDIPVEVKIAATCGTAN